MKGLLDEVRSRFDYLSSLTPARELGDRLPAGDLRGGPRGGGQRRPTPHEPARRVRRTVHASCADYPNGRLHLVVNRVKPRLLRKALSSEH